MIPLVYRLFLESRARNYHAKNDDSLSMTTADFNMFHVLYTIMISCISNSFTSDSLKHDVLSSLLGLLELVREFGVFGVGQDNTSKNQRNVLALLNGKMIELLSSSQESGIAYIYNF
jgi:hypothetical protein